MEKSPKRGKIPPQDWPSIISRYEAGETLASIARTYDCSPPAISYIVSRTRARNAVVDAVRPVSGAEPQLVKRETPAAESAMPLSVGDPPPLVSVVADPPSQVEIRAETAAPEPEAIRLFSENAATPAQASGSEPVQDAVHPGEDSAERHDPPPREPPASGGGPRPQTPSGSGEPRRTLHLSLSGGDGGHRHDRESYAAPNPSARSTPERGASSGAGSSPRPFAATGGNGGAPIHSAQETPATREGGTFIDQALRERVGDDVAAFLAAFDAALDHDSAESRTGLREATDRLLRAGARTRIELERLEARMPLVPRDKGGHDARGFRPR